MGSKNSRVHVLPTRQILALVLAFIGICGFASFLVFSLALPGMGLTAVGVSATASLLDDVPDELSIQPPSSRSVMLAADGSKIADFYADNRIVVESGDISDNMKKAIVAIEDQRFYQHHGIDPEGMLRASMTTLLGVKFSGASTITQQFVKNALIDAAMMAGNEEAASLATERSLARKVREARYALAVEKKYSKDQILTGYLNLAPFGPNIYGVESAAQHYFSQPAKELSVLQAATLAGITQSPTKWDPVRHPEQNMVRRNLVLAKMKELGYIDDAEYQKDIKIPVQSYLHPSTAVAGCAQAGASAYFCEYVVKYLLKSSDWGKSYKDRVSKLYRGGLVIKTTLDPAKQAAAAKTLEDLVPSQDPSQISMALSSLDPTTGQVVAMAQNTKYGAASDDDPTATRLNLNVDLAYGGGNGFQTGSTFKGFVLTQWFKEGHSLYELVNGSERTFHLKAHCLDHPLPPYSPHNLEGDGRGYHTVLDSTKRSLNVAFVDMADKMDLCDIAETATKMGFKLAKGTPFEMVPSAVLGSNTSYPLSMAQAYGTLAANGTSCDPQPILEVKDSRGRDIFTPKPHCQVVLDPEVAKQVTYTLSQVVSRSGTAANAILNGRPAAGKTGTSNNDVAAWFVGYTPQLVTAIWQGHKDTYKSMYDAVIKGRYYDEVYGGLFPAKAFRLYMNEALKGLPVMEFEKPENMSRSISSRRLSFTDEDLSNTPGLHDTKGETQEEAPSGAPTGGDGTGGENGGQAGGGATAPAPVPTPAPTSGDGAGAGASGTGGGH